MALKQKDREGGERERLFAVLYSWEIERGRGRDLQESIWKKAATYGKMRKFDSYSTE